ncbi:hypothetical protein ACROYT_G011906 [Oculina patagonica]
MHRLFFSFFVNLHKRLLLLRTPAVHFEFLLISAGKLFFRIVTTLHARAFSWLPFPIGQVRSQVWCRPYLAAYFGFFELRKFPWSPRKVQVSTFYPFTLKVG